MKRSYILSGSIILFVLTVLLGINFHNAKQVKQQISVGMIAPLTGNRADAGEYMRNALTLFQENNEKRSAQYDFIIEDDKYSNDGAVTAVHTLLDARGVQYLIGPYGTPQVLAIAPITETARTIVFIPGAQADTITDAGEYLFRLIHNSKQEAPRFGDFVSRHMKSETIYFLAIKNDFAVTYLKNIKPAFESAGKSVILVDEFLPTDTDFKTHLLKVKVLNPTDIFAIATPKQMGLIARQARELEISAQFYNIGVESPDLITAGG